MKKIKTITVNIDRQDHIVALMRDIKFYEVDRVAVCGQNSACQLMITFEGDSDDYHEKGYFFSAKDERYKWSKDIYTSIKYPNGETFNSLGDFIADWRSGNNELIVKHIDDNSFSINDPLVSKHLISHTTTLDPKATGVGDYTFAPDLNRVIKVSE